MATLEETEREKSVKSIEYRIAARLIFLSYCAEGDILTYIPPILYQPLLSFARAKIQHSKFFYQWYSRDHHQRLFPRWEIHIDKDSKDKITHQLRPYGLDQGTIFGDYGNIVKDIIGITT